MLNHLLPCRHGAHLWVLKMPNLFGHTCIWLDLLLLNQLLSLFILRLFCIYIYIYIYIYTLLSMKSLLPFCIPADQILTLCLGHWLHYQLNIKSSWNTVLLILVIRSFCISALKWFIPSQCSQAYSHRSNFWCITWCN